MVLRRSDDNWCNWRLLEESKLAYVKMGGYPAVCGGGEGAMEGWPGLSPAAEGVTAFYLFILFAARPSILFFSF